MRQVSIHGDEIRSGRGREPGEERATVSWFLLQHHARAPALSRRARAITRVAIDDHDLGAKTESADHLSQRR